MSSTRIVGNLQTSQVKEGYTYTLVYFVLDADKATYTPYYGLAGNTAPFGFPAGTYIYEWEDEPYADHWLITIKAHDNGWQESGSISTGSDDPTKTSRSIGLGEIVFYPEWWGIRMAAAADAPVSIPHRKNISGADCKEGDWVFINSSADGSVPGTPNYRVQGNYAPFTVSSITNGGAATDPPTNMPYSLVNKRWPATVLTATFFRTDAIEHYILWKGLNPTGAGAWQPPAGISPTGFTDAGRWKSVTQSIDEKALYYPAVGGTWYHKITRQAILATGSLRWDDAQYGWWDW